MTDNNPKKYLVTPKGPLPPWQAVASHREPTPLELAAKAAYEGLAEKGVDAVAREKVTGFLFEHDGQTHHAISKFKSDGFLIHAATEAHGNAPHIAPKAPGA